MCVESHDPTTGKCHIASDSSLEALEARLSNLKASEAVCEARRKQLEEEIFHLKTANEELRKMWERDRKRTGMDQDAKDDVL